MSHTRPLVRRSSKLAPGSVCPYVLHCHTLCRFSSSDYYHFEYLGSFLPSDDALLGFRFPESVVARVLLDVIVAMLPLQHLSVLCTIHSVPVTRSHRNINALSASLAIHVCGTQCTSAVSVFRPVFKWSVSQAPKPRPSSPDRDKLGFTPTSSEIVSVVSLHPFSLMPGSPRMPATGDVMFVGHMRLSDVMSQLQSPLTFALHISVLQLLPLLNYQHTRALAVTHSALPPVGYRSHYMMASRLSNHQCSTQCGVRYAVFRMLASSLPPLLSPQSSSHVECVERPRVETVISPYSFPPSPCTARVKASVVSDWCDATAPESLAERACAVCAELVLYASSSTVAVSSIDMTCLVRSSVCPTNSNRPIL